MPQVVKGAVDHRVACAQDTVLRKVNKSIATCVGPTKEMELNPAATAIFKDELLLLESLFRWLRSRKIQGSHVFASLSSILPAFRLVPFHLLSNSDVGERGCTQLRPYWIPVSMVAMMMSIKYILDGLLGRLLDVCQAGFSPTGEISVDNNQIVLHFDPDVVAVTFLLDLSFSEPYPRGNLLYVARSGLQGSPRTGKPKCYHAQHQARGH